MTYDEFVELNEEQIAEQADERVDIKGFNVYLGTYWERGYCAIVIKNGRRIYYADIHQLHYDWFLKEHDVKELRNKYIESLNSKLFTEEELKEPLKTYDEYNRKSYFLHNYYGMQEEYISQFFIVTPESEAEFKEKTKNMYYNPVCFGYFKNKEFVEKCIQLHVELSKRFTETDNNFEYQKSAFLYEMYNHEYGINWQADYDVISCFGRIKYREDNDINKYFDEAGFNETQKKAYIEARNQYYKEMRNKL